MNLRRRTLKTFFITRPAPASDTLSGMREHFAAPHLIVQGHLLPTSGQLKKHAAGLHEKSACTLLVPPGSDIRPGDGVGETAEHMTYRVVRCDRYPLHVCAHLEERAHNAL